VPEIRFVVGAEHDGARCDVFVAARLHRPRAHARRLLLSSGPRGRDGRALKPATRLRAGEEVRLDAPDPPPEPDEPVPFRILYADADLLAVEKPAGVPMHPAGRYVERTLVRALRRALDADPGAPAHRLDRDTSGVVLFLRSARARRDVGRALRERRVQKLYLALTSGAPQAPGGGGSGLVDLPVGLDPAGRVAVRRAVLPVAAGGAPARTRWRVLARRGTLALVAAAPLTGRPHQLRVHLAALGAPVAGDRLYGPDPRLYLALRERAPTPAEHAALYGLGRHALHAAVLRLAHPADGRPVRFVSPFPADLASLWEAAR
jgi:23S rRNA pseudouridine1911/1915/1917 synthase